MPHLLSTFSFKYLNGLTWLIIVAFIAAIFTMVYFSPSILWEGIVISIPLIVIALFWSEKTGYLIKKEDDQLTKKEMFLQDLFLITYSFFLAVLFSLLFQYNNSDVKGWWPLIIYIMSFYGFVFALTFSLIALILNSHKIYSIIFSLIIFCAFLFSKFWPLYFHGLYIGNVSSFFTIYFGLISIHLLICIFYKSYKLLYRAICKQRD